MWRLLLSQTEHEADLMLFNGNNITWVNRNIMWSSASREECHQPVPDRLLVSAMDEHWSADESTRAVWTRTQFTLFGSQDALYSMEQQTTPRRGQWERVGLAHGHLPSLSCRMQNFLLVASFLCGLSLGQETGVCCCGLDLELCGIYLR